MTRFAGGGGEKVREVARGTALGKIFLACDRADAKCEVYESLCGMAGVLGLRGQLDAALGGSRRIMTFGSWREALCLPGKLILTGISTTTP